MPSSNDRVTLTVSENFEYSGQRISRTKRVATGCAQQFKFLIVSKVKDPNATEHTVQMRDSESGYRILATAQFDQTSLQKIIGLLEGQSRIQRCIRVLVSAMNMISAQTN